MSDIPLSLKPSTTGFFTPPLVPPQPSRTTHQRRLELITARSYINHNNYNGRYKLNDVRMALGNIYKGKCAFCEQKVEQSHVEHYRPKAVYYWLAFSWDNLILACATCNQNKGIHFDLNGTQVRFGNVETHINNINFLSASYNLLERPKMVNPETTEPLGQIYFTKSGVIDSNDVNFKYTINKCKISRTYLRDERKRIIDALVRDLTSVLIDSNLEVQKSNIGAIIEKFMRDSKDDREQFLAFRRYAISENWFRDIIVSLK